METMPEGMVKGPDRVLPKNSVLKVGLAAVKLGCLAAIILSRGRMHDHTASQSGRLFPGEVLDGLAAAVSLDRFYAIGAAGF